MNPEMALIGTILANHAAMETCMARGVTGMWFEDKHCRSAFEAATDLWGRNRIPDPITVGAKILTIPTGFFDDCLDAGGVWTALETYIDAVEDGYYRRSVQCECVEIAGCVLEDTATSGREWAEQAADRLTQLVSPTPDARTLGEISSTLVDEWQQPDTPKRYIPWGIPDFDHHIGRLSDEYVMLAARPSVGKTAMALQLSLSVAESGRRVSFCSLESGLDKLAGRLISHMTRQNTLEMKRGEGSKAGYDAAKDAANRLKDLPINAVHAVMSLEQIHAYGRAEQRRGSTLLIVDNLRHIKPTRKYSSRIEQFADFSLRLKWLRDELGLPVIALHHLSRNMELAWSDDILRDLDVCIMLNSDDTDPDKVTANVSKNRDGKSGASIDLNFDKNTQTFHLPGEATDAIP